VGSEAAIALAGAVVLITGATGGVGNAAAPAFARAGASLALVSRSRERLEHLALSAGIPVDQLLLHPADLTDPAQARGAVDATLARFGRLDVVVNLLGSWAPGKIASTSDDLWHGQLASNLHAVFYVLRAAAPRLSDGGAIVNVANAMPVEGRGGQLAYAVAKGGVITLTQSLALELKPRSIRVNGILPRNIDTPGNRALQPNADYTSWPSAEDVAQVVLFLCSPEAAAVSGALVPVYGGS
jgi:NAD(P)-dependent dehydrogenase (short-subunit alcohol dehydrogenase family)